jgi:hypothetical protein
MSTGRGRHLPENAYFLIPRGIGGSGCTPSQNFKVLEVFKEKKQRNKNTGYEFLIRAYFFGGGDFVF